MIEATEFLNWMDEYFKGWVRPPTKLEKHRAKQEFKRQKQINMSNPNIKVSTITRINAVNPWNGPHGIIYYTQCEMANGDKIELGKKKELQVGWELVYSIVDTQQEWNKAQPHKKEDAPQQAFGQPVPPAPSRQNPQQRSIDVNDAILYQVALKGSMDYLTASHNPQFADTFTAQNVNDLALSIAQIAKANIQKL